MITVCEIRGLHVRTVAIETVCRGLTASFLSSGIGWRGCWLVLRERIVQIYRVGSHAIRDSCDSEFNAREAEKHLSCTSAGGWGFLSVYV